MKMYEAFEKPVKDIYTIISIACRVDINVINQIKRTELAAIVSELEWLFTSPEEPNSKLKPLFWMHGIEYGFIPNFELLTVGEFADLDMYTLDGTYKNLSQIMRILYRPVVDRIGRQYNIVTYEDYNAHKDIMDDMPIDAALSAMVFFYAIEKKLVSTLEYYLSQHKIKTPSLKSGDGTE
jgi:hypothetical protein